MKKLYSSISTILVLSSIVLVAKPDFDVDRATAKLITDRSYDLNQEKDEFYAMHKTHAQGISLEALGLDEQSLHQKLKSVFDQTRQSFKDGQLELVVVKDGDELLGSVFFCQKEESGGYIRIQHLNSPVIDQFATFAKIFEKMLPLMHKRFPSERKIICVTRTAIQVYKDALESAGFTQTDFLPEGCDRNSQVAYVYCIVD